jgi:N-ethylmaleimide reductase
MSKPSKLLEPFRLGPITLPNRLVMAPLTRNRAVEGLVPGPLGRSTTTRNAPPRVF